MFASETSPRLLSSNEDLLSKPERKFSRHRARITTLVGHPSNQGFVDGKREEATMESPADVICASNG